MTTPVREQLLASSDEFRRLAQDHETYSKQLDSLASKPYPSEDDKIEQVRLKKLKLRLKDQMEFLERNFQREHPGAVA